jgi:hypothetical protein
VPKSTKNAKSKENDKSFQENANSYFKIKLYLCSEFLKERCYEDTNPCFSPVADAGFGIRSGIYTGS